MLTGIREGVDEWLHDVILMLRNDPKMDHERMHDLVLNGNALFG